MTKNVRLWIYTGTDWVKTYFYRVTFTNFLWIYFRGKILQGSLRNGEK